MPNISLIIDNLKLIMINNRSNINLYIDVIRLYSIGYRSIIKNQICGDISESPYQIYTYYKYVKKMNIYNATICEIGFLYGVSSLTFLLASGITSQYYGFDYGHFQSKEIYKILSNSFNMKMVWGKSQETVPLFNQSINCDIVHIDGSHNSELIIEDIRNMRKLSNKKTLVIVDDITYNNYAWKNAIMKSIISEFYCSEYKSFCIGRYI